MPNFYITGLPRSRTAWFSAYLTTGQVYCHHELAGKVKTLEDYESEMARAQFTGNSDCSHTMAKVKSAKTLIIRRPMKDVYYSLKKINLDVSLVDLALYNTLLDNLDGWQIEYGDINNKLEEIHDYLGLPDYDHERAKLFKNLKINIMEQAKACLWSEQWR